MTIGQVRKPGDEVTISLPARAEAIVEWGRFRAFRCKVRLVSGDVSGVDCYSVASGPVELIDAKGGAISAESLMAPGEPAWERPGDFDTPLVMRFRSVANESRTFTFVLDEV